MAIVQWSICYSRETINNVLSEACQILRLSFELLRMLDDRFLVFSSANVKHIFSDEIANPNKTIVFVEVEIDFSAFITSPKSLKKVIESRTF